MLSCSTSEGNKNVPKKLWQYIREELQIIILQDSRKRQGYVRRT